MLAIIIIDLLHVATGLKAKMLIGGTRGQWFNYRLLELGCDPETCSEMLELNNVNSENTLNSVG